MQKRIKKMKRAIEMVGGVDIVLTHAAPLGVGDWDDASHRGFKAFLEFIDQYHPKYLLHGHVHLNYGMKIERVREYSGTKVINCCEKYELEYDFPRQLEPLTPAKKLYCRWFLKNLQIISL
jgi:Icc-related predicted phosphoesterase